MVTTINGATFGSIAYIDGVSINDIARYMGAIITPPIPNYYYAVGSFGSFNAPTFNRIVATDLSGSIDTTFNMGIGFNNTIRTMATQSDGKIIVGGDFTSYSGSATNYLIRLNTNGTKDTTFTSVLNQAVYSIAVQSDDKIIIGGAFTTVSGISSARIARLDVNGARDASFNVGAGSNQIVRQIAIQSDGKPIIVGAHTSYSGSAVNRITRINTNGSRDTTFNIGTGLANAAYNVSIQSDGKILTTGDFTSYSGSTNNRIVRINTDGTKDTTYTLGTGFNNSVYISNLRSDGKLVVAGPFTTYSGSTNNYIVRINIDGTKDTGFDIGIGLNYPGWGGGLNNSIAFDSENNIYLASDNLSYSGSFVPRIFKVKDNGTLDSTYNPGIGLSRFAIANLISGSRLYTAGLFVNYQTPGAPGIAMISDSATLSSSFNPGIGFNGDVYTIVRQSDGKVIAGGAFTNYSGSTSTRLVRINTDGTLDTTFNVGTAGATNLVYDLAVQTDDKVIVGGTFTSYSGSSTFTTRLMRLNTNGTQDLTYNTGVGLNSYPLTVLPTADGKVLVLGLFTTYSGSTVNYITRTNSNGTRDTGFNTGTGFSTGQFGYTAVTQSDGKYIIGGNFTTYSGSAITRVARLNTDGTRDTSFSVGAGANTVVSAVAMQSDGKVVVGGQFTTFSGSSVNRLVRLNSDGSRDLTFNVGTGLNDIVLTNGVKIDADGIIYCVGNFTTYSGSSSQGIVAINPNGTINQTFNSGLTSSFNDTGRGFTINETVYRLIPA